MKRDMDLVRKILLYFDSTDADRVSPKNVILDGYSTKQTLFHIEIMTEAGLLDHRIIQAELSDGRRAHLNLDGGVRPTMAGYDFLDAVRDAETWKKTKDGALAAGGWTIDILKDLAKGLAKKKLEDLTGIKL